MAPVVCQFRFRPPVVELRVMRIETRQYPRMMLLSKALLLAGLLLFASCALPKRADDASPIQAGPTITATPNPVPLRGGAGQTTIVWKLAGGGTGQVYMSPDGGPEQLFAGESAEGRQEATWINSGTVYEFRLYESTEHRN